MKSPIIAIAIAIACSHFGLLTFIITCPAVFDLVQLELYITRQQTAAAAARTLRTLREVKEFKGRERRKYNYVKN